MLPPVILPQIRTWLHLSQLYIFFVINNNAVSSPCCLIDSLSKFKLTNIVVTQTNLTQALNIYFKPNFIQLSLNIKGDPSLSPRQNRSSVLMNGLLLNFLFLEHYVIITILLINCFYQSWRALPQIVHMTYYDTIFKVLRWPNGKFKLQTE